MMFDLRKFVLQGLRDAVGKMEGFRVKLNAAGWHDKGVLSDEDLTEIKALVDIAEIGNGEEAEE